MRVVQGKSAATGASEAVAEATRAMGDGNAPSLLLVFASTKQDPREVAAALATRFPGVPTAGCTTAGEIVDGELSTGALVVSAIWSPEVRWAVGVVPSMTAVDAASARKTADELFARLGITRDQADPNKHFCITFMDGLCMKEEHVVALMADALEGLPLVGGSAGDDLAFQSTRVFANGEALTNAAVLLLAVSEIPFHVVKHQHYKPTERDLVITRADVEKRRVYEIDGRTALHAYAAALGLSSGEVTDDVTFMNPLTFAYGGELYVRSIQKIEDDGSLVFYCGIEEGMVLAVGGHEPMAEALARDLSPDGGEPAELFVAFNCILRALEIRKRGLHGPIGDALRKKAKHVIGFDTYGEQLDGLHINQTLVGIALGGSR